MEFNCLLTGAEAYSKDEQISSTPSSNPSKKQRRPTLPQRNTIYINCKDHADSGFATAKSCFICWAYESRTDFKNGLLPRGSDVLDLLITERYTNKGKNIVVSRLCAEKLCLQWIYCNVYPLSVPTVNRKIDELHELYRKLQKFKSKSQGYWTTHEQLFGILNSLFDVIGHSAQIKSQEKLWGPRMIKRDWTFYNNQSQNPPLDFCTSYADRKWKISNQRRLNSLNRSRDENFDFSTMSDADLEISGIDDLDSSTKEIIDEDYSVAEPATKKRKFIEIIDDPKDDLPFQYRHIRHGPHKTRSEVYEVMTHLKTYYHMSQRQAEGAIVTVANGLFGRDKFGPWTQHSPKEPYTVNTLPASSSNRRVEPYMEAMALGMIVEDIMSSSKTCIVYSHDGSETSVVGKFVVQSLTINGVPRSLPTFGIFTEKRDSLSELTKTTLAILSASSGGKYEPEEILGKVKYTICDSTAHNLKVIDKVCQDLDVSDVPPTLLCNVHPLMMMQLKIKELCQSIHDNIGNQKISECFLVDVEFKSQSFVLKAINCLSNFISKDYSSKPWNRSSHFESFIKPKKNMSLCLKNHWFNRLQDCCLSLLYHLDDLSSYLDKFTSIVNGISILDRSFVDMEVLKPIFTAISLIGIHITRPFQTLLIHPSTNYSTLLEAFATLYKDLTTTEIPQLIDTNRVLAFASNNIFKDSLPESVLLDVLVMNMQQHREEVIKLLSVAMRMFAEGFSHQKGAIFGFGPQANTDTKNVLKIATVGKEELAILDKYVPVHNMLEERNVGNIQYEVAIRGKKHLESASRNLLLMRSSDLIAKAPSGSFKYFKKQAADIKKIKYGWTQKMEHLKNQGYEEQNLVHLRKEKVKLDDLDFLKQQPSPGPFTKPEEVTAYLKETSENNKQDRLYVEIRYARLTSLTLKQGASVFRLRRNGKKLTSDEYANNLIKYLSDSRNIGTVTMHDLTTALDQIMCDHESSNSTSLQRSFKHGEHIAVAWIEEDNIARWYLCLVNSVTVDGCKVSNFIRVKSEKDIEWIFPEDPDEYEVDCNQVIMSNINVLYLRSMQIRCSIDEKTVSNIQDSFEEVKEKLYAI